MVIGELTKAMGAIGDIAITGNKEGVAKARRDLVVLASRTEILADASTLRAAVDANIGYIAGMYEPVLGNRVLEVFGVEHPFFGNHIPDTVTEAYDMGKKQGREYAKKLQTEAEIAKKNAQVAKLGVMLPESDETVDNDSAAAILNAIRVSKGGTARPVMKATLPCLQMEDPEDEIEDDGTAYAAIHGTDEEEE